MKAPTLGRVRKQDREGLDMDALDLLELFLDWEPMHDQAATLPTLLPGSAGRRPDFPPVMAVIFGLLYWLGYLQSSGNNVGRVAA